MVNHLSHAKQWYLCRTRSLIGRPGAANRYATADWLSAVDGQYKKTVATMEVTTVICSIGLGGLGRRSNRPELIEDYSKPNSIQSFVPVPCSPDSFSQIPVPCFQSSVSPAFPCFPLIPFPWFQSPVSSLLSAWFQSCFPWSSSLFPVPCFQSSVSPDSCPLTPVPCFPWSSPLFPVFYFPILPPYFPCFPLILVLITSHQLIAILCWCLLLNFSIKFSNNSFYI